MRLSLKFYVSSVGFVVSFFWQQTPLHTVYMLLQQPYGIQQRVYQHFWIQFATICVTSDLRGLSVAFSRRDKKMGSKLLWVGIQHCAQIIPSITLSFEAVEH